jgi:hypothetical protein
VGSYLGAIGANCTPTRPPSSDIIHGSPTITDITCEEGFLDLHNFVGRDAAKKSCYMAIDKINDLLIRQKKKKGIFGAVRDRETGKPLNLRKAVKSFLYIPTLGMKMNSNVAADGHPYQNCVIPVKPESNASNERRRKSIFPPAQVDTTVYFYYWARALDIASQIIDKCFDESSEHRGGQVEDAREIGYGNSKLQARNWTLPYTVSVKYYGAFRPCSDDTSSWTNSQISLPDIQGYQPHPRVPPPNTQDNHPPPGRLRQTCQRIYNRLLCANHMPL